MLISFIFALLSVLILSLSTGAVLYLFVLAIYGIIAFRHRKKPAGCVDRKYIILIPAHNEELLISSVIESLRQNDYPEENYEIIVIADNCDDDTAGIAREKGATAWERHDPEHKGKGFALEWAINRIDLNNVDIIAVIDADCIVDPDFLKITAGMIDSSNEVVQTSIGFTEVQKSTFAYLEYLSSLVENYLFYNPRAVLGLHCHLKGTGMVFKSSVFSEVTWSSHSITEDMDYSLNLNVHGKKVLYTTFTKVKTMSTVSFQQAFGQRVRGSSGIFQVIKKYFFKLFSLGIKRNDPELIESALSLLMLSRPTMIYVCIIAIILGLFGNSPVFTTIWGGILVILLIVYLFLGIFLSPVKGPFFKAVVLSPFFGIWLFLVQILSILGFRKSLTEQNSFVLILHGTYPSLSMYFENTY